MAGLYDVWFMKDNIHVYLDSGTCMIHDGNGHDLYQYKDGKLFPRSGGEPLLIKPDGRKGTLDFDLHEMTASLFGLDFTPLYQVDYDLPVAEHAY